MEQQDGEEAGRDHEDCEFGTLEDIQRPVPSEALRERGIQYGDLRFFFGIAHIIQEIAPEAVSLTDTSSRDSSGPIQRRKGLQRYCYSPYPQESKALHFFTKFKNHSVAIQSAEGNTAGHETFCLLHP
ncbi:MAG TPA: hypothetical protein VGG18_01395 [Granulicella sp.]|jgi:hypothetical protein